MLLMARRKSNFTFVSLSHWYASLATGEHKVLAKG
jgi:hypothetical protein